MKRLILFTALATLSLSAVAQDDLYFNPKDEPKPQEEPAQPCHAGMNDPWRGGCPRDVDEYNRRGPLQSHYQIIGTDSTGSDIIQFETGDGTYPDYVTDDSLYCPEMPDDDYQCTRQMSRWDDYYGPYDIYYASRWGWGWPYRYGYYGWYDPWYADLYWGWGGYYGWYDPWFYGYRPYWGYGWGYPGWGGHYHHGGIAGTMNHGTPVRRGTTNTYGNFGGRRTVGQPGGTQNRVSRFGGSTTTTNQNRSFGGQRRTGTYNNTPTRSYSPSPSRSTSSYGGGSRGGSFGGGSRGGGSFGGGSRGGGGSFGGRR